MSDTITSGRTLNVGLDYVDDTTGKTRTIYIKLPNPKDDLTESTIRNQMNYFTEVILDPNGNEFSTTSVGTAYTLNETKYKIDLE